MTADINPFYCLLIYIYILNISVKSCVKAFLKAWWPKKTGWLRRCEEKTEILSIKLVRMAARFIVWEGSERKRKKGNKQGQGDEKVVKVWFIFGSENDTITAITMTFVGTSLKISQEKHVLLFECVRVCACVRVCLCVRDVHSLVKSLGAD